MPESPSQMSSSSWLGRAIPTRPGTPGSPSDLHDPEELLG
jgi:hypothetical protein